MLDSLLLTPSRRRERHFITNAAIDLEMMMTASTTTNKTRTETASKSRHRSTRSSPDNLFDMRLVRNPNMAAAGIPELKGVRQRVLTRGLSLITPLSRTEHGSEARQGRSCPQLIDTLKGFGDQSYRSPDSFYFQRCPSRISPCLLGICQLPDGKGSKCVK